MAPSLHGLQCVEPAGKLFKHQRKEIKDRAGSLWTSLMPKDGKHLVIRDSLTGKAHIGQEAPKDLSTLWTGEEVPAAQVTQMPKACRCLGEGFLYSIFRAWFL